VLRASRALELYIGLRAEPRVELRAEPRAELQAELRAELRVELLQSFVRSFVQSLRRALVELRAELRAGLPLSFVLQSSRKALQLYTDAELTTLLGPTPQPVKGCKVNKLNRYIADTIPTGCEEGWWRRRRRAYYAP
jgi:hypothetical protein